jgi:hypothetical protein
MREKMGGAPKASKFAPVDMAAIRARLGMTEEKEEEVPETSPSDGAMEQMPLGFSSSFSALGMQI